MALSYCGNDIRQHDYNRYLLALHYPAAREALFALFVLNYEIARTRSVVTDTTLGHIRLQWWRDRISEIYDGQDGGNIPALSTLAPIISERSLPFAWFDALLLAREFDLEDVAPASLEGLRNYADFINMPLSRLTLKIISEETDEKEIVTISMNYELMNIVRSVPFMLAQHRCYLPSDLLAQKSLTPQKIIDFNHQKEIVDVIKTIVSSIHTYRKPQSAFLHRMQRMTNIYLKHLEKNGFNVFSPNFQALPPFLAFRLALPSFGSR
jgi:NADH dehydrogenase [ubiquinone] 1 alpha subcomplex assembly factor 6